MVVAEGPIREKITKDLRGEGGSLAITTKLGGRYFREKKQIGLETKACQVCLQNSEIVCA